jgi:DNA-binding protein H-NS
MSSADFFSQANRLRGEANVIRQQAAAIAESASELSASPGRTANLLERKIWAGPKATTMQQKLTDLAQLLRFHADQSLLECEELLREARRLEEQAEQLDAEGRRWVQAEAEAEAARLRQANAAKANATAAAFPSQGSPAASKGPSVDSTPAKPALVFAPIETAPVENASHDQGPGDSDANAFYF